VPLSIGGTRLATSINVSSNCRVNSPQQFDERVNSQPARPPVGHVSGLLASRTGIGRDRGLTTGVPGCDRHRTIVHPNRPFWRARPISKPPKWRRGGRPARSRRCSPAREDNTGFPDQGPPKADRVGPVRRTSPDPARGRPEALFSLYGPRTPASRRGGCAFGPPRSVGLSPGSG